MPFDQVPSVYPQLLELRKSKTADFKPNSYLKESTKLRYYQVIGALHMILLNRMVLGDATGVGKTAMAIGAYSWILSREPTMKLLVVAPKSALFQWADEFDKFTQNISVRVLTLEYAGLSGIDARKKQYEDFKENVLIVGYAQIRSDYIFLKKALGANYTVIYDEATAFKGRKTQTYFAAQELAQSASRVYGLSATIIKNSLEEVWSIYSVIVPGLFGKITNFLRTYTHQKLLKLKINGQDRYIPQIDLTKGHLGHKNLEQFKKLIDPYILVRKKEEVESELPPIISKKVILEMEPDQKALYKKAVQGIIYEENVKRDFFEISDKVRAGTRDPKILEKYEDMKEKYEKLLTGESKKHGKLAALTYCQMISNGPGLIGEPGESSKEIEFERLLTEELLTEKIIVFSRFKRGIPNLEIICDRKHIQYSKITGDVLDAQERDNAKKKFLNNPECRIIFITMAGAESLNLQAASVVLFYDTPWSYGDLVQIIGRAQRIGSIQNHILLIHFANKGTIDMRVIDRVSGKKELSSEIIGDTSKGALDFSSGEENVVDDLFNELLEDGDKL